MFYLSQTGNLVGMLLYSLIFFSVTKFSVQLCFLRVAYILGADFISVGLESFESLDL